MAEQKEVGKWEQISTEYDKFCGTSRLKVPGGWLYREIVLRVEGASVALAFVPNPPRAVKHGK